MTEIVPEHVSPFASSEETLSYSGTTQYPVPLGMFPFGMMLPTLPTLPALPSLNAMPEQIPLERQLEAYIRALEQLIKLTQLHLRMVRPETPIRNKSSSRPSKRSRTTKQGTDFTTLPPLSDL